MDLPYQDIRLLITLNFLDDKLIKPGLNWPRTPAVTVDKKNPFFHMCVPQQWSAVEGAMVPLRTPNV